MRCPECGAALGHCRVHLSDVLLFPVLIRPARCTRCMKRLRVPMWKKLVSEQEAAPRELDWEYGRGIDYRLPR